jgi:enamine deaminase RidA (YjgF/YER057c/UK114 family)
MANLENALKKYGLTMPKPPAAGGVYEPVKEFGEGSKLLYCSGCGSALDGKQDFCGKLGAEYTVEQGQQAARCCALNLLANLQAKLGSLDKVKRIVKTLAFVAGTDSFYEQPQVVNGASQLFIDVFGEEAGRAARSAIGVNALPGNQPVEIELLVEVK